MSIAWTEQRERGGIHALRLMTWLAHHLGYRATSTLLYPICLYFLVFSPRARFASRAWLARVLGRAPRFGDVFRHFHVFAGSLHDRIALYACAGDGFNVRVDGGEALDAALARGRGCLLLGSHLGSFEVLRAMGESRRRLAVNLVMHEPNAQHAGRWMRELAPELAQRVIAPGQPETLLRVRECLERGEIVAMLGDRPLGRERTIACEFLGKPARFPAGPLLTAALLDTPVVLFFCLRRGPRRYDAYFEPFAEPLAAEPQLRDAAVANGVARYARRLEARACDAPFNWFNFYDFWQDAA